MTSNLWLTAQGLPLCPPPPTVYITFRLSDTRHSTHDEHGDEQHRGSTFYQSVPTVHLTVRVLRSAADVLIDTFRGRGS